MASRTVQITGPIMAYHVYSLDNNNKKELCMTLLTPTALMHCFNDTFV